MLQDSSSSQENVSRLGEESSRAVTAIKDSIGQKKQEVRACWLYCLSCIFSPVRGGAWQIFLLCFPAFLALMEVQPCGLLSGAAPLA